MSTGEGSLDEGDDQELEEPRVGESGRSAAAAQERTSKAPARPKKRRPRDDYDDDDEDDEEETPVVGGHFFIAAGLILAATLIPMSKLGDLMEPKGPEPTRVESWSVGSSAKVRITLVTADYNLLGCESPQNFDKVHCAYKSPTEPWPRAPGEPPDDFNNKLNIIQPYRTWFDNKLVFVAGLWATPDVAYRVHSEPAQGILPDKLARFAVECDLTFLGRLDNVKLRWNPQQSWVDPDGPAWVGRANACHFIDEPQ